VTTIQHAVCLLAALGLGACNAPATTEAPKTETVAPAAPSPAVPLAVSLNAVMVGLVDHSSHSVWDAAVPEKAPKTDKAWQEVEHHAIQIAAAGSVIAMPGTGKSDAEWVKNPEWQKFAKELSDAGVEAWTAAKNKDKKAISDVGDKLVTICEGCHKAYKGDLPTEGIVHPH
jgi:hypothetical protein